MSFDAEDNELLKEISPVIHFIFELTRQLLSIERKHPASWHGALECLANSNGRSRRGLLLTMRPKLWTERGPGNRPKQDAAEQAADIG